MIEKRDLVFSVHSFRSLSGLHVFDPMRHQFCLPLILLLCSLSLPEAYAQQAAPEGLAPIAALQVGLFDTIQHVEHSIVTVAVFQSTPEFPVSAETDPFAAMFSGQIPAAVPARLGTGVILREDPATGMRSVLTCAHLLEPAFRKQTPPIEAHIFISCGPQQTATGRIVALDGRSNLAVLQCSLPVQQDHQTALNIAEKSTKGELILAFGDPRSIAEQGDCSVGLGMISALRRNVASPFVEQSPDPLASLGIWMRVDEQSTSNLSGGGIFNLRGELTGISTALPAVTGPYPAAGFAIPCTGPMRRVIQELLQGYEVSYGFLGIQPAPLSPMQRNPASGGSGNLEFSPASLSGITVQQVTKNSPAERAGLIPNDLILAVNGNSLAPGDNLDRELALLGAGTEVEVSFYRPATKELLKPKVRLSKWPISPDIPSISTASRQPPWRGASLDYPSAGLEFSHEHFLPEIPQGVLIRHVLSGSPAARAGLKGGEFIAKVGEQPVETPDEFEQALKYWSQKVPVTLSDGREVLVEESPPAIR